MSSVMYEVLENDSMRADVVRILRMAGEEELAAAFDEARRRTVLVGALGDDLDGVASVLERVAVDPSYDVVGAPTIDFATALRLYGPPEARRGTPLEWTKKHDAWYSATDQRGTHWSIEPGGRGWGLTIANWDRPDWWVRTPEDAMLLAAEIVARPSFRRPPRPQDVETIDLE